MNVLTDIETAFLSESDRLAEREPFDYAHPRLDIATGHAAAWLLLKSRALEKAPVSFADLETALCLLEQPARLLQESPEGGASPSPTNEETLPPHASPSCAPATAAPLEGLETLAADLATLAAAAGPARDFYGGYTIWVAGVTLHRLLALDTGDGGRLARLMAGYVLLRRSWPLVVFRLDDEARLDEARKGETAAGAFLIEKVREHVTCGHCRVGPVTRLLEGLTTDTYQCGGCGAEFKLDWKGLQSAWRLCADPASAPPSPVSNPSKMPSRFVLRNR